MGKTGKWLKNFLSGKKDKDKEKGKCTSNNNQISSVAPENPTTPISIPQTCPKEKKRWSFRRSSATSTPTKDGNSTEKVPTTPPPSMEAVVAEDEQKKHATVVAMATAAAADAAAAAAQAAEAVIRLTGVTNQKEADAGEEEAAAIKIQAVFRSYLARKALNALRGIVKLQALVRGHLVRKQATTTLRCMQALVTAQARALAQRIRMDDESKPVSQRQSPHRRSTPDHRIRHQYHEMDREMEENIKIVEMDRGDSKGNLKSRNSYSHYPQEERVVEHRISSHYPSSHACSKQENYQLSPAASALTDMSPRACSGHFEDYSYTTAQSSPQYYSDASKPPLAFPRPEYAESMSYDYPLFPNYMANTESSRAKARSQSAPKSRPETFERQPSRRRASVEGRNHVPRAVRMQRSSSHVGTTAQNYQYPWSIRLDRSAASLKDSECGSTSTVLTNINYCRSLVAYNHHGEGY